MVLDLMLLTNAITDVVYKVDDAYLTELNVCNNDALELKLKDREKLFQNPAGSPANVGFSASVLGLKVAIRGTLGGDEFAKDYAKKVLNYGMLDNLRRTSGKSGVCYTFITSNSAGDNYAAGFLYSYLKGFNLEFCCVVAQKINSHRR